MKMDADNDQCLLGALVCDCCNRERCLILCDLNSLSTLSACVSPLSMFMACVDLFLLLTWEYKSSFF